MFPLRFAIAFAIILMKESICLRVVEVVVPAYRVRGETALLECQYELERDTLYSVKWYKDNEEFYRFLPKFSPPHHSYRIDGIKVDHHQSDDKKVTLKAVTLKSSGMFRCEVSAEAPSFASAQGEGRMEVVYLPKDGPHITGQQKDYQIGDTLSLNCTSGRSYPAALLQWYVNEEEITSKRELEEYSLVTHQHGLVTAILGLRLPLAGKHFPGGALRARCVARVSPVLWSADRESLLERVAPLIDNREALLLD
ncbi:cell adhesion molecule 2-like isoform X2 [Arctopsyche grandis]|uniref:cell adhesion molecule 2-like isoform X2 n=1 Tax=Arctopsyche grandis TaxID=121162 RepID=UPI00406D81F2